MSSCFFIGHREAEENLLQYILAASERLSVENDVTEFYVGGYGNFDRLAGRAVVMLKARYPSTQLFRVIPYHPAEYPTEIPEGYDGTFYPFGMENVPRRFAIPRANRSMIETCDYLIAYVTHTASNAHRFLEYARRREKKGLLHIVNLADAMANH